MDANGTTSVQNSCADKGTPGRTGPVYTGISIGQNGEITAIREGDPAITLGANTGWIRTATLPATSYYNGEITITNATAAATITMVPGNISGWNSFSFRNIRY
jgi:hypothetical protein